MINFKMDKIFIGLISDVIDVKKPKHKTMNSYIQFKK